MTCFGSYSILNLCISSPKITCKSKTSHLIDEGTKNDNKIPVYLSN